MENGREDGRGKVERGGYSREECMMRKSFERDAGEDGKGKNGERRGFRGVERGD